MNNPNDTNKKSGICLKAKDTGRILLLLREVPGRNQGKWEFPGGHIEVGETSLEGAIREWEEEVGIKFPKKAKFKGLFEEGIYTGYIFTVKEESSVKINPDKPIIPNPDEPDGRHPEIAAWWHPDYIFKDGKLRPDMRDELSNNNWDTIHKASKWYDEPSFKPSRMWYEASVDGKCTNCGAILDNRLDTYCPNCVNLNVEQEALRNTHINPNHPEARPWMKPHDYSGNE